MIRLLRNSACLALGLLLTIPAFADDEDAGRRIEEVVVYGERVESTVSDTSISITAMDSEFLSDMGIQGPNEMMNFIPATTRTDWDVKIRGIGRNFRGLVMYIEDYARNLEDVGKEQESKKLKQRARELKKKSK